MEVFVFHREQFTVDCCEGKGGLGDESLLVILGGHLASCLDFRILKRWRATIRMGALIGTQIMFGSLDAPIKFSTTVLASIPLQD